jgi:hypothetical protein
MTTASSMSRVRPVPKRVRSPVGRGLAFYEDAFQLGGALYEAVQWRSTSILTAISAMLDKQMQVTAPINAHRWGT